MAPWQERPSLTVFEFQSPNLPPESLLAEAVVVEDLAVVVWEIELFGFLRTTASQ